MYKQEEWATHMLPLEVDNVISVANEGEFLSNEHSRTMKVKLRVIGKVDRLELNSDYSALSRGHSIALSFIPRRLHRF